MKKLRTTCCLLCYRTKCCHPAPLFGGGQCAGSQPRAVTPSSQHQQQAGAATNGGPPLMGARPKTDWADGLSYSLSPICERHYLQTSTSLLDGDVTEDGINRVKLSPQPLQCRTIGAGRNTAFLAQNTAQKDDEPAGAARGHVAMRGLQRRTGAPQSEAHPGRLTSRPAPPRSPRRYRGGRRFFAPPAVAPLRRPPVVGRRGLAPPPPPARRIAQLPSRTAAAQPGTLSRRRLGLLQLPLGGGSGARCLVPRAAFGQGGAGRRRRLPQEPLEGRVTDQRFRAPLGHGRSRARRLRVTQRSRPRTHHHRSPKAHARRRFPVARTGRD